MKNDNLRFDIRPTVTGDINAITQLKYDSIAQLNANDYSAKQIAALQDNNLNRTYARAIFREGFCSC